MIDNYKLWEIHDAEQAASLHKLPKCKECGEHIQQERAVYIGDNWYCDNCLDENRRYID